VEGKEEEKGRKSGNWAMQRAVLGKSWLRTVVNNFFRHDSKIKREKIVNKWLEQNNT
jgi:hypothetical protein